MQAALRRDTAFAQALYDADARGFGLHAAVHCAADGCRGLEPLCRSITRPALASERLLSNPEGLVVVGLKTPWRNATTHLAMAPLGFMQRLALLVPRPLLQLIRFRCGLASRAMLPTLRLQRGRLAD